MRIPLILLALAADVHASANGVFVFGNLTQPANYTCPVPPAAKAKGNAGAGRGILKFLDSLEFDVSKSICAKELERFRNDFKERKHWALKMFDANAKLPSGILKGNLNQFGDFDECLEVAKYCLVEFDLTRLWGKLRDSEIENLVHSDYMFRGTNNDPKHRVPNFFTIKWGMCIPKLCNISDVTQALSEKLDLDIYSETKYCQVKQIGWKISIYAIIFFVTLMLLTVVPSLLRVLNIDYSSKLLKCFEVQANWVKFNDVKGSRLKSLDGIRAFSALALVMSHKAVVQLYGPYVNGNDASEHFGQSWSILGRTAALHTDTFLLLSGLLTARSMIGNYSANRKLGFKPMLVERIFRILPNLLVVIIFCTEVMPHLSSGPYWPLLIGHHAELCRKYWWRNLLFIQNQYPFEEMCLTHTHHIAIDMQLFLASPLVVYVLLKWRNAGYVLAVSLIFVSCLLKYLTIVAKNLSYVVYFGSPISQMFDTANYSYTRASQRAGVYWMGILLAFALRDFHKLFASLKRRSTMYVIFGFGTGIWVVLSHHRMGLKSYAYGVSEAGDFGALGSLLWAASVSWTIHASENNYGGLLPKLLSWKRFEHFSKIAYAFYLVQFPVLFHSAVSTNYPKEFKPNFMEVGESVWMVSASVLLTLLVEIPARNVHKLNSQ